MDHRLVSAELVGVGCQRTRKGDASQLASKVARSGALCSGHSASDGDVSARKRVYSHSASRNDALRRRNDDAPVGPIGQDQQRRLLTMSIVIDQPLDAPTSEYHLVSPRIPLGPFRSWSTG